MDLIVEIAATSSEVLIACDEFAAEGLELSLPDDFQRFSGAEVLMASAVVFVGAAALDRLGATLSRLVERFRPCTVLDLTGGEPRLHILKDGPRGHFVVKSSEGDTITDITAQEPEGVAEVLRAALLPPQR